MVTIPLDRSTDVPTESVISLRFSRETITDPLNHTTSFFYDSLGNLERIRDANNNETTYTIEITGDVEKLETMINMLKPLGIKELIRTGRIAIARETTRTASPRREPALLKT